MFGANHLHLYPIFPMDMLRMRIFQVGRLLVVNVQYLVIKLWQFIYCVASLSPLLMGSKWSPRNLVYLWMGSNGYYDCPDAKYLWMDGHISNAVSFTMSYPGRHPFYQYHDWSTLNWFVSCSIALANHTNRIWVMPKGKRVAIISVL